MDDAADLKATILQRSLEEVQANDAEAEPCVICLEPISEGAVTKPCHHHNFDYLCLLNWLEQQSTCPLCKAKVEAIEYTDSTGKSCLYHVPEQPTTVAGNRQQHRAQRWAPRQDLRRLRPARPLRRPAAPVNAVLTKRRDVYIRQLYSLHVGSNRQSAYQDLTPTRIASTPALVSRARAWIRRELEVFTHLDGAGSGSSSSAEPAEPSLRNISNAFFLLEYIVAMLKTVDIRGSDGQAQDMLADFLGRQNARLFLHELQSFLRSPYETPDAWDRHVQYPKGNATRSASENSAETRKRSHEQDNENEGTSGVYDYSRQHGHRQKRRHVDRYVPD